MKKQPRTAKLHLSTETVRTLQNAQFVQVVGGQKPPVPTESGCSCVFTCHSHPCGTF